LGGKSNMPNHSWIHGFRYGNFGVPNQMRQKLDIYGVCVPTGERVDVRISERTPRTLKKFTVSFSYKGTNIFFFF